MSFYQNILENGPVIVDWYAIEEMAFGSYHDRIICPLCGGFKNHRYAVCFGCRQKHGNAGLFVVLSEIARLTNNHGLWNKLNRMVAKGAHQKKHKSKAKKRTIIRIDRAESDKPHAVLTPEIKKEVDVIIERASVEAEAESECNDVCVSENGILLWASVIKAMSSGFSQKHVFCPACEGRKMAVRWVCSECRTFFREAGIDIVSVVKHAIRKANPRIKLNEDLTYRKPTEEEWRAILLLAETLIKLNPKRDKGFIVGDLARLKVLRKVDIAFATIAVEQVWERSYDQQACLDYVLALFGEGPFENPLEFAQNVYNEELAPFSLGLLTWATKTINKRQLQVADEEVGLGEKALAEIKKNLRESENVAIAFRDFLMSQLRQWQQHQIEAGKSYNAVVFFQKIGYTAVSWGNFKKNPIKAGMKVSTANKIIESLGYKLEDAIEIGINIGLAN